MPHEIQILPDTNAIAKRAAQEILASADAAMKDHGSFNLVLSGGSTPKPLHHLLVDDPALRSRLPWDKMHIFFGDERHVAPDHSDSNYKMASDTMISKSPLKPGQISRIKGEYQDPEKAAVEYEQEIRAHFHLSAGQFPRFDALLLGMGSEGHTASLFPGTKALHESSRIAVRNWVGKLYTERITLTAPAINNSAKVIFLVAGADKALALKGVLEGPVEPEQLPAQMIQPQNGKLLWLIDAAAGSSLAAGAKTN